jgi:hypothetical protein
MPFPTMALFSHVLLFDIYFFGAIDDSISPLSHPRLLSLSLYTFLLRVKSPYSRLLGSQSAGYATRYHHSLIYIILPPSASLFRISFPSNPQISSRFHISPLTNQWRVKAILICLMIINYEDSFAIALTLHFYKIHTWSINPGILVDSLH